MSEDAQNGYQFMMADIFGKSCSRKVLWGQAVTCLRSVGCLPASSIKGKRARSVRYGRGKKLCRRSGRGRGTTGAGLGCHERRGDRRPCEQKTVTPEFMSAFLLEGVSRAVLLQGHCSSPVKTGCITSGYSSGVTTPPWPESSGDLNFMMLR